MAAQPWWQRAPFPIEEYRDRSSYVVRVQLPGLDPARDITVAVADNEITIDVCRPVHRPGWDEGLFHERPVRRTVRLPPGARDETLTATYRRDGILELVVELPRPAPIGRVVPIRDDGRDPAPD